MERQSSLVKHEKSVQDANTIKLTTYMICLMKQLKRHEKTLVYHVKERLKQHSRHAGMFTLWLIAWSQFFGVFKGYIHQPAKSFWTVLIQSR